MPSCVIAEGRGARREVGEGPRAERGRGGSGRMRTVTSVSTPNAPSEPRNSSPGRGRPPGRRPAQRARRRASRPGGRARGRRTARTRGGLAARPHGGEAADGRELEALREVAQRVAVRAQQLLGCGPVVPAPKAARSDISSRASSPRAVRGRARSRPGAPRLRLDAARRAVPPPNGTTAMPRSSQTASTASTRRARRATQRRPARLRPRAGAAAGPAWSCRRGAASAPRRRVSRGRRRRWRRAREVCVGEPGGRELGAVRRGPGEASPASTVARIAWRRQAARVARSPQASQSDRLLGDGRSIGGARDPGRRRRRGHGDSMTHSVWLSHG